MTQTLRKVPVNLGFTSKMRTQFKNFSRNFERHLKDGKRGEVLSEIEELNKLQESIKRFVDENRLFASLVSDFSRASESFSGSAVVFLGRETKQEVQHKLADKLRVFLQKHYPRYWSQVESVQIIDNRLICNLR